MQISQSGWQWGNPTPQGNTIRAMDFIAGAATRSATPAPRSGPTTAARHGRACDRHIAGPRASRRSRPTSSSILGGDGCVVRRSDDGGGTFRKIYVLAETDCPEPVTAAHFVTPEVGYLMLRNGNVLRTTDGGETSAAAPPSPARPAAPAAASGVPADALFTTPDAGLVFIGGTQHRVPHDRRGRVVAARAGLRGNVQRVKRRRRDHLRVRAEHAAALHRRRPDLARRGAGTGDTSPASAARPTELCLMSTEGGDAAAHRERRRDDRADHGVDRPLFAAGLPVPHTRGRGGSGRRDGRSDDGGTQLRARRRRHRGLLPVRPAARAAPTRVALGARGHSRARPTAAELEGLNVATSADMQDTSFASAIRAMRWTSAAACSARATAARAGRRSTRARPRRRGGDDLGRPGPARRAARGPPRRGRRQFNVSPARPLAARSTTSTAPERDLRLRRGPVRTTSAGTAGRP